MADYFEQTVVQQTIPDEDMTPIERLLLSRIFDSERDGEHWSFFAEQSPSTTIFGTRTEIEGALAASCGTESVAHACVTEQLVTVASDAVDIELDLSGTSWEFFLQDIVKRSRTLRYVSVVAAFTCSKMRPDGFGGMAVLITPDAIFGKSTSDLIGDFLVEAGLEGSDVARTDIPTPEPDSGGAQ